MPTREDDLLKALQEEPNDLDLRLVFADWLEEQGDRRTELLRLTHALSQAIDIPKRPEFEARLRGLLQEGVKPVGPFWTNNLGMKFVWVPPGTFMMGSPIEEHGRFPWEIQHKVTLTRGFYLGVYTVTQEQWQRIMGTNPSKFKSKKDLPVETVSWDDCQGFIKKLCEKEKDTKAYRLPTEAEWEYACRSGTTTPYHFGETISTDQVNYNGMSDSGNKGLFRRETTPVGTFPGNAWGLHDMHGNVFQWCQDWYDFDSRHGFSADTLESPAKYYPKNDEIDPKGPETGEARVLRGGSWSLILECCRSAYFESREPGFRFDGCGLRVCFALD